MFRNGLLAFEGILAGQLGRSALAAEAEARKVMEDMMPGFGLALDLYLADQRDIIETIKLGNLVKNDGGHTSWYSGPRIATGEWPEYKKILGAKLPEAAVQGIDESTTRILSRCANPKEPGDRRKGLVIGYVQSGKTAAEFSTTAATNAATAKANQSGVNLDEEAARLMQYQQAYQAAAKYLQVAQGTFDTLIQSFG